MTTLTEASIYTRSAVKYGVVIFIFFIIGAVAWKIYTSQPQPEPPPVPTVKFGKLPLLKFPEEEESRPAVLTLQTIHGGPPEAATLEKVYSVTKKSLNLLSGKRAQQFASLLEFPAEPMEKTADQYLFVDSQYPARTLRYNLASGNFILDFDLIEDPSLTEGNSLPLDNNRAISEAETLLSSLNRMPGSLAGGSKKVTYLRFENNEFVVTDNKLQAQFVRVDFLQVPIAEKEIKTPGIDQSSVYVIFSGRRLEQERIARINYAFFPVDENDFSTYPLKNSQSAWEELAGGGGYIVNIGDGNDKEAIIRDAYLAYFDPGEEYQFLQPIFVFTGDRNFEAYVSAVSPDWTE